MSETMSERWIQALVDAQAKVMNSFTSTVERFIARDETNHREFRTAIATLATAVELLRAEQKSMRELAEERHQEKEKRWQRVWTTLIAPVIAAVLLSILALVLKGGI